MLRKRSMVVFILILAGACNFPAGDGFTLSESPGDDNPNPCAADVDFPFAIEAASATFTLIGSGADLAFTALGENGARQLAAALIPDDTFCSLGVSPATQAVLDQVEGLVDSGDTQKAADLLATLLADLRGARIGGKLSSIRPQASGGARQNIADMLNAGDMEVSFGLGDGRDFYDAAGDAFRSYADGALDNASFDETMRILDEAQGMGEEGIANEALERARDILGEDLDASIEDFDPCLPNDKILEQDIRDLLNKLAQAIVLGGVPGTYGPGGSRYDAVMSKVWRAAQGLNPEAAMSLPEPDNPPPECEATYELEIDIHTVCPEIVEECYEPSCVTKGTFRYGAEIQIVGRVPLTISADAGTSQVQGEAEVEMTGEALIGLCTLTGGEGSALITVGGSIGSDADGQPSMDLTLDETWYHTWSGQMVCPDTGSQSWDVPPTANSAEISLRMLDGFRLENTEHLEIPQPCDTTYIYVLHVSNVE